MNRNQVVSLYINCNTGLDWVNKWRQKNSSLILFCCFDCSLVVSGKLVKARTAPGKTKRFILILTSSFAIIKE